MKEFFYSNKVQTFIAAVIVFNAIIIGIQTFPEAVSNFGWLLDRIDYVILAIFTIEVLGRLYYERFSFFQSGWNWFDLIIVSIGYMPDSEIFTVLRIVRVLRIFRLFSVVPQLRLIVDAMFQSIPSLGWVVVFALILNYVFAIIGFHLYGQDFPKYFGDLPKSMYTMFEMMTRAGWNTLTRLVAKQHPDFYMFIIPYILVASYIVLNLIMGVLVNSMKSAQDKPAACLKKDQKEIENHNYSLILAEIACIKEKLAKLEEEEGRTQHK